MNIAEQVSEKLWAGRTIASTGILRPTRPDRLARIAVAYSKWGASPATGYAIGAIRHPGEPAIIDELGQLTFEEVHRRTNALADSFARAGVRAGDGVAILCRNHRGFIDATIAASKLGANCLYLNTAFAAPQVTEVLERETPAAVVFDEEFTDMVSEGARDVTRFVAWFHGPVTSDDPLREDRIEQGDPSDRQ